MESLNSLREHQFVQTLITDAQLITKDRKFKVTDTELPVDVNFEEWEYHIHNVGFYTMHLLHLCNQLYSAIDFLSSYSYKETKSTAKRIEHLEYNLENFIIRLASVKDRTLQVINAVFHIGMDEGDVSDRMITNNIKVSRTKLPASIQKLTKAIKSFSSERNAIVHRHTYLDKEIKRLYIFYGDFILGNSIENGFDKGTFKHFRTKRLKKFLEEKKTEMEQALNKTFKVLLEIFTLLQKEYSKVKQRLIYSIPLTTQLK